VEVIVVAEAVFHRRAHCLFHLGVIEVDEPYPRVPHKQRDQSNGGRTVIDGFVLIRTASGLADHVVLSHWTTIHLDTPLMSLVPIVFLTAADTDVSNTELSVADGLCCANQARPA
jgi:hypothetical protein